MVHTCFSQSMSNPTFFQGTTRRISFIETQRTYFCQMYMVYRRWYIIVNHFTNYKIYIWNMSCVCSAVFSISCKKRNRHSRLSEKPKFLRNVLFAHKKLHISVMSDQMILVNADSLIAAQMIFCCKK